MGMDGNASKAQMNARESNIFLNMICPGVLTVTIGKAVSVATARIFFAMRAFYGLVAIPRRMDKASSSRPSGTNR